MGFYAGGQHQSHEEEGEDSHDDGVARVDHCNCCFGGLGDVNDEVSLAKLMIVVLC